MYKSELVILKLGGSIIVEKDREKTRVNVEVLKRLSKEIKKAKRKKNFRMLLVHGAGCFGHVPAKKYSLNKTLTSRRQVEGFSLTHHSMEKLNFCVLEALQREKINAIAYQPSALGILKDRKLDYFPVKVLKELLSLDVIPVAYGDVLIDKESGINILSGDHLVFYTAKKLKADRVIIATDVEGIFDFDPKKNRKAKLIKEIDKRNVGLIKEIDSLKKTDVTGGMRRKLQELLNLSEYGIESEIISGLIPDLVERSLSGEKGLGTIVKI